MPVDVYLNLAGFIEQVSNLVNGTDNRTWARLGTRVGDNWLGTRNCSVKGPALAKGMAELSPI